MDFDVGHHLGAAERSVESLVRDTYQVRAVVLSRVYPTTVADLWDATTNAERIPKWFVPVTGELRLGGHYQLESNAGGTIETCVPESHFAVTWEFGGGMSWLSAKVSDHAGGARLVLTHTAPLTEHWLTYGPGAVGVGWDLALTGLALHLATPEEPKLDEAELAASPEGKAFVVGSCEAWGQAAIANGEAPDDAHAAAQRTRAFYTGENV